MASMRPAAIAAWVVLLLACVPEGPPTKSSSRTKPKPSPPARTVRPTEQPGAAAAAAADGDRSAPLTTPFVDARDRKSLGGNWRALAPVWKLHDGELCGQGAKNRGIWLKRALPVRARIEFDARSESAAGDIKAEFWGDGRSGATQTSYTDATSYLTILGGWNNTRHVLARIDEHGADRLEFNVNPQSPDPRGRPVEPGQTYRFRVERSDESTLSWWVDDELYFEFSDPEPLAGEGHDHFGFNNWTVPVCFDNLKITPL